MSWARGHSSLTENTDKPVVDRCINCGDHEQVQTSSILITDQGLINKKPSMGIEGFL